MHTQNHHALLETFQVLLNVDVPEGGKAIIDVNGTILWANDRSLVFSLNKGALLSGIFPEIKREVSPEALKQSIINNKSIRHNVLFAERGEDYWFQLTISPLAGEADLLFLVEFADITDYKSAVATAKKQRQRMENEILLRTKEIVQTDLFVKDHGGYIGNFMRGLRHDLLSPVAQLKDIIEYNRETNDPKKKEQSARLIDNCLEKLSNTARGFSDFVDLHILPQTNMESILMEEVFTEVETLLGEEITLTGATVTKNFAPAETLVFNRMVMYSIVHNLLSNAIKFRREGTDPVIAVKTFKSGHYFVFAVEDNGTGIDLAAHGAKLFVPFQRLDPNRSGVGVGLSMIKNALVRYEGDIQIESVPGEGTTVSVYIPQG